MRSMNGGRHANRVPRYLIKYLFIWMSLSNEKIKNKNTPINQRCLFTLITLNFFLINIIIVSDLTFEKKSGFAALFG